LDSTGTTTRTADSIGVEFIQNRPTKASRRVDENAQNETILDDKSNYKVHLTIFISK